MRAFIVVAAMLAVPLSVSVAQQSNERSKQCAKFAAHKDATNAQGQDQGQDHVNQCPDPTPPPPAPSCGPAVAGNASVAGTITTSAGLALSGACVSVYDATGALVAGGLSNSTGSYTVSLVANGLNYSVCATSPTGATQTSPVVGTYFPACPGTGFGSWTFPIASGDAAIMLNFVF
jgi:hypothetical protein